MTEFQTSEKVLSMLRDDDLFRSYLSVLPETGVPMLIFSPLIPKEWKITDKTVNIYTVSNASRLEYRRYRFRASCRANTYVESRTIALRLMEVLNRCYDDQMFITTTVMQTVNPSDAEVDNFNTPVEILVRTV